MKRNANGGRGKRRQLVTQEAFDCWQGHKNLPFNFDERSLDRQFLLLVRATRFLDNVQENISAQKVWIHGLVVELEMAAAGKPTVTTVIFFITLEGRLLADALQNGFKFPTWCPAHDVNINGQSPDRGQMQQHARTAFEQEIQAGFGQMPQQGQRVDAFFQQQRVNRLQLVRLGANPVRSQTFRREHGAPFCRINRLLSTIQNKSI